MKNEEEAFKVCSDALRSGRVSEAMTGLQRLSEGGFGHADTMIGAIYEFGNGSVAKDVDKAARYYRKAVDSVGAVEAWLGLGRVYSCGPEGLRDYTKAFECFFCGV